ncbi:hypothetical protein ACN23B_13055 [Anabaena sp. FACHB-709]|uniref:AAA ATPase AAA+ lid domain-containing protein n=1 Tax=Anabaena cylindrica FACHB-318 TaxID=2692880 RepID=A0ABR7ZAS7_ANACY|nr:MULTISPECIES: hypothetical protein [Nostocaceae]MBD2169696.1 hypothetical protein [Anabaena cylindrica FACHB-318]MBD2261885.1 hypothetical protein [Anabaena sp. FACHB-709]MBD2271470.1 hypothetical protein [Nostoc sp. PCC 7120 = FACHB-418]MBD2282260.1 hypothetical protein [Anabaena cylindrica FACHB-170]MBD2348372.1 hypothetical protein [Trichormus variabilis FACHB-171]
MQDYGSKWAIAGNTTQFSGAELETLAAEAALLAFDQGRFTNISILLNINLYI